MILTIIQRTTFRSLNHSDPNAIFAFGRDLSQRRTSGSLLQFVELLAKEPSVKTPPRIEPGSAQGMASMAEDFDTPLADFEAYMK